MAMNLNQARRCALYARLSVTKEESVSIARQLESCRKYAEARGWEVVGEFIDGGVSATANRPEERSGWAALLASSDFDAVVIWKVDRLARRVLDFLHADEALQRRGAGLVAVEDPIDMTSPQGRAFAVMLARWRRRPFVLVSARLGHSCSRTGVSPAAGSPTATCPHRTRPVRAGCSSRIRSAWCGSRRRHGWHSPESR